MGNIKISNEELEWEKAEKAISHYRKASENIEGEADLRIYFIEIANKFTLD